MPGQGNRDGRTSNLHLTEHYISRLLYEKGISRKSFRLRLGIKSPQYYHKCMQNPAANLSTNQLTMIADVLDMKLLEIIGIVMGKGVTTSRKWYQDNADAL